MTSNIIDKEKINPLVLKAVGMMGSLKSVAEKIGKSPMAFTQIKKRQSLPALETLGALRLIYGLNINAVIDGNENNLFSKDDTPLLKIKIEELELENCKLVERLDLYEKMLKKMVEK
jgi:transcriptional regulator with XRE-family HTH domain